MVSHHRPKFSTTFPVKSSLNFFTIRAVPATGPATKASFQEELFGKYHAIAVPGVVDSFDEFHLDIGVVGQRDVDFAVAHGFNIKSYVIVVVERVGHGEVDYWW